MVRRKSAVKEDIPFEAALQALEIIVDTLESGELTLEESLARFEEGIQLVRHCSQKLDAAEKRIDLLVEEEGRLAFKPFGIEEETV